MTLDEYQDATRATAQYPLGKELSYTALGLVGEAGEYANKIKKMLRGDVDIADFDRAGAADELGDVLWYLARAADELGFTLDEIAEENLLKLADRQRRGVIKGSGDKR